MIQLDAPINKTNRNIIIIGAAVSAFFIIAALAIWGGKQAEDESTAQEPQPAPITYHEETYETGRYNLEDTGIRICGYGDDYLSCVNAHVSMYNSLCISNELTSLGAMTCSSLNDFIDSTKAKYKKCGNGCTTAAKDWGWTYHRLAPETTTRRVPDKA